MEIKEKMKDTTAYVSNTAIASRNNIYKMCTPAELSQRIFFVIVIHKRTMGPPS